ncbi:MAG: tRNA (adenosine(37)-N6)-threonylcarbamoyltransferase complex ATPase subunit type 1 TsaE [Cyanobacteria bacterium M_surface_9_m1_291]|nr:tRNA (adenosine(37)-N6)-threonylcarbamoyltransferase complex ATPase subunit type 1 TsaE [Cyanobacteria bacterium M_surface_9_m1_291]
MHSRSVILADTLATQELGNQLGQHWLATTAGHAAVLLLRGDLGAGKTCLVQGIARALAIAEPITSPTFALAQHYRGGRGALVHLDLYRLEQSAAADELFVQEEEAAGELGALLAVEWPERLSFVPEGCWMLDLTLVDPQQPDAGRLARLQLPA